jgi:hypothetical protein
MKTLPPLPSAASRYKRSLVLARIPVLLLTLSQGRVKVENKGAK